MLLSQFTATNKKKNLEKQQISIYKIKVFTLSSLSMYCLSVSAT